MERLLGVDRHLPAGVELADSLHQCGSHPCWRLAANGHSNRYWSDQLPAYTDHCAPNPGGSNFYTRIDHNPETNPNAQRYRHSRSICKLHHRISIWATVW